MNSWINCGHERAMKLPVSQDTMVRFHPPEQPVVPSSAPGRRSPALSCGGEVSAVVPGAGSSRRKAAALGELPPSLFYASAPTTSGGSTASPARGDVCPTRAPGSRDPRSPCTSKKKKKRGKSRVFAKRTCFQRFCQDMRRSCIAV